MCCHSSEKPEIQTVDKNIIFTLYRYISGGWDSILAGFQLVVGFANWIEIKYDPAFVAAFESL